jgi:hypothetical protein
MILPSAYESRIQRQTPLPQISRAPLLEVGSFGCRVDAKCELYTPIKGLDGVGRMPSNRKTQRLEEVSGCGTTEDSEVRTLDTPSWEAMAMAHTCVQLCVPLWTDCREEPIAFVLYPPSHTDDGPMISSAAPSLPMALPLLRTLLAIVDLRSPLGHAMPPIYSIYRREELATVYDWTEIMQ